MKVDTNWSIKPNLINEGGFGFTRYTSGSSNSFNGLAWTNAQGWQGLQNLFYNGIPEMDFNNIQSLNADRLTSLTKSLTYEYSDTLIWTKGNHTFKFGTDIQTPRSHHAAGLQRLGQLRHLLVQHQRQPGRLYRRGLRRLPARHSRPDVL